MHSQFGACDHQGITHIVAGISHVYQTTSLKISKMLTDGQHIGQHLCRMIFICQTIPYRNSCIFCKVFYDFLSKSSVFDSLIHSSENSCCVCNALLLTDLRTSRVQIGTAHSKIVSSYFKCTACSCTCLFEDQGNIFAFVILMKLSGFFLCF